MFKYRVNSTRLKTRILAHFPDLQAHEEGRRYWASSEKGILILILMLIPYTWDVHQAALTGYAQQLCSLPRC